MRRIAVLLVVIAAVLLVIGCKSNPEYTGGKVNIQNKLWDKAVENFQKAVEIDPTLGEAYYWMAFSYFKHTPPMLEEAGEAILKAKELKVGDGVKPEEVESLHTSIWTEAFNKGVNANKRITEFKKELAAAEDEAEKAKIEESIEKNKEIMFEGFELAKKIDPEKETTFVNLAALYLQYDNTEKAVENIQVLIDRKSEEENVYINAGAIYMKEKDYDEAIKYLAKGVENIPEDKITYKVYDYMARAYMAMDDADNAIKMYETAKTKKDGDTQDVYGTLGSLYYQKKNYEKAIENFDKVMEIDPENTDNLYNIGVTALKLEDYDKAVEAFQALTEFEPDNADHWSLLGSCYAKRKAEGDKEKSLECFQKAEELNKMSSEE